MAVKFISFFIMFYCSTVLACGQEIDKTAFHECRVDGSITIYDYNAEAWRYSNEADIKKATLPASTFKIMNTLISLETGVIADEHEIIPWPGETDTTKYGYRPNIYHDMNMKEAFKKSAGWVYVELAKKIGKDRYRKYHSHADYGNGDLSIDDPDFWNFGKFGVTPREQIRMLIGVYEEMLPFSARSFDILKRMMVADKTNDYTLRAKTGWTRFGGKDTGWWVGYIEKENNAWFFATRIIKNRSENNPRFVACRKEITYSILRDLDIIR